MQKLDAEAGFEDNYILTTEGIDSKANLYPYAQNKVYYALSGDIEKISLENGDPVDATNRVQANFRSMFMGKTQAILQAPKNADNASVVVAAILGDKSLYLSKEIVIYAEQLQVKGKSSKSPIEILYTINGDDPAKKGKPYQKPFKVTDGTIVKAILKQNNRVLFEMNESFGANEGLFWGDEHSEDIWIGRGISLPAEEAILKGSAKVSDKGRRFKNDGFVTFDNKEGSITWYQENDGQASEYFIRFRYTHNDTSGKRPMTLLVNDKVIETFEFKPTGSWEEGWGFIDAKVILKAGANNIELKTMGQSGPNIDEMFVD